MMISMPLTRVWRAFILNVTSAFYTPMMNKDVKRKIALLTTHFERLDLYLLNVHPFPNGLKGDKLECPRSSGRHRISCNVFEHNKIVKERWSSLPLCLRLFAGTS